jgi:ribosomal protein L1
MPKRSKLYKAQSEKITQTSAYQLIDALNVLKEMPQPKFDQTVELSF